MLSERYIQIINMENRHWWYIARRKILSKIFDSIQVDKRSDILEVGCGSGGNLQWLSEFGNLYAMEIEDAAIEFAQKRNIAFIEKGALPNDIPFGNKQFDIIAMFDVLEHIDDDLTALKKLRHRVKQGGMIMITVPAYHFLWSRLDDISLHKRRYVRSQLNQLVKSSGFSVRYSTYFNTFLFPLIFLIRIADACFGNKSITDGPELSNRLNNLLTRIFALERFVIPHISLPYGVSILTIAVKEKDSCD